MLVYGFRESSESWADLLRDCKRRGIRAPTLLIGDRALGFPRETMSGSIYSPDGAGARRGLVSRSEVTGEHSQLLPQVGDPRHLRADEGELGEHRLVFDASLRRSTSVACAGGWPSTVDTALPRVSRRRPSIF